VSIDKHLEKAGVVIDPNNTLPAGSRTQKDVSRLIHAVRAAEASFNEAIHAANEAARIAQGQVIEYQARVANLEMELRKYKLKERMEAMDNLSVADRQLLLTST
jgi:multidrug resistance efflux pump